MAWFDSLRSPKIKSKSAVSRSPDGIWTKCVSCGEILYRLEIDRNFNICPRCEHHFPISPRRWIELILDADSFEEARAGVESVDPLHFKDLKSYRDRLKAAAKKSEELEAFVYGTARMKGIDVVFGAFAFAFMGGSMGSVVGDKIASAFELSAQKRFPLIIVSSSGGARMQEGLISLMQMAKTVMARERQRESQVPFVSVLAHPTTGGVAASFAMLGDFTIAEPGALIGFAGPRVIEQTIKEKLPENFQSFSTG